MTETWLAISNAEAAEDLSSQAAGRHARRGFPGAGALEDVANVLVSVLDRSREVRMPRPRSGDLRPAYAACPFGHVRLDVHCLLPVDPVAIANQQRDRRAGRPAMANPGEDLHPVAFDGHPSPASVTPLAPPKLVVECVDIEFKARRHPVNGDDQCLAVRLTRSEKSQHAGSFYLSCVGRWSHPPAGAREATVRPGPGDTLSGTMRTSTMTQAIAAVLMTLAMSACGASEPQGRRVFFVQPADGATVKSPVRLEFGAAGFHDRGRAPGHVRPRRDRTSDIITSASTRIACRPVRRSRVPRHGCTLATART